MGDLVTSFSEDAPAVIITGDAITEMRRLPDKSCHLIVSSPPYNIGKPYEKRTGLDVYLDWQTDVIREMIRLLPECGSVVWQTGNYVDKGEIFPLDMYFYPIFKKMGLRLRNRIIWHYEHGLHASKRFSGRYEVLLWFTKSDNYTFHLDPVRVPSKYPGKRHYKGPKKGQLSGNPLGKNPSDYWSLIQKEWDSGIMNIPNVKHNHPEKTDHPCQFPVELVERCVLALTSVGDHVLDPFGGSGSALIAALKHDRVGIMIDKNTDYTVSACDRVQKFYSGSLQLRSMCQSIYQPSPNDKTARFPDEWIYTSSEQSQSPS